MIRFIFKINGPMLQDEDQSASFSCFKVRLVFLFLEKPLRELQKPHNSDKKCLIWRDAISRQITTKKK